LKRRQKKEKLKIYKKMGGPPPKPELSNYIASEDVQKVEKR